MASGIDVVLRTSRNNTREKERIMITKNDAIAIGKSIVAACSREKEQSPDSRYNVNGACGYALDNLWYDVFPVRTKEQFKYNIVEFYNTVWPD